MLITSNTSQKTECYTINTSLSTSVTLRSNGSKAKSRFFEYVIFVFLYKFFFVLSSKFDQRWKRQTRFQRRLFYVLTALVIVYILSRLRFYQSTLEEINMDRQNILLNKLTRKANVTHLNVILIFLSKYIYLFTCLDRRNQSKSDPHYG